MNILYPQAEIHFEGDVNLYHKVETIGRVCYKSEDNIGEGTYDKFISTLIKRGHNAMLEHATFTVLVSDALYYSISKLNPKYLNLSSGREKDGSTRCIISGSVRGFKELYLKENKNTRVLLLINNLRKKYPIFFQDIPMEKHGAVVSEGNAFVRSILSHQQIVNLPYEEQKLHRFVTVKFIVNRGVSHEIVRHRPASYAQSSTRYCNYSHDKFGSELNLIDPLFYPDGLKRFIWKLSCRLDQLFYNILVKRLGSTPQEARDILPNALQTELYMTANVGEWEHFFSLRIPKDAHPSMREVTLPLYGTFIIRGIIEKNN
jgi:thymidylate synthase (FAD)